MPPPRRRPAGTSAAAPDTGANPSGCVDDPRGRHQRCSRTSSRCTHAENYSLTYADTYKVLTVGETGPGGAGHTYVLVQCGTDAAGARAAIWTAPRWWTIPVDTIFSESTSHDGFIDVLGLADLVTGVANGDWVMTPSI